MSTTYATDSSFDTRGPLAAAAGAAAGLARPLGVSALSAAGLDPGIVALTLQPDLPMWWLVHLAYSFAFGALYGAVAYRGRFRDVVARPATGLFVGAAYGILLWTVNVVVFWELVWTSLLPVLDTGGSLVGPLVGHLVYGALLGALYPLARRYV
jgi:hypothetical protein